MNALQNKGNIGVWGSIDESGRPADSPFYGYTEDEEAAFLEWEARCKAKKKESV
jgi:hypothetical protein